MPASSAPNPRLVVETGRLRGASFEVPPGRSEIGRQAGVAILLDDRDVSRRHAVLERTGGRVVLTDPGSTTAPGSTGGSCAPAARATGSSCATATRC
jgi:pSer/pThr/pTyr-binding forkhead associated (FHA) protein